MDLSLQFKNLTFNTRHDRVAGLGNSEGSQKALNMLFALRTIQERTGKDLGATFLSGTTISNSLTELYLLFKYLRPKELERQNINCFDAWAAIFAKLTADYETFTLRAQTDEDGYYRNLVKLDGLAATDAKSVGTRLQEIAKNATTGGEYLPIGELYGFPILVKTESSIREGVEVKQNRFFIEGAYKYTYNNGQLAMSDHKAAATNFLNALDRIPKLMEQYKTENEKLEKDLPTLREVASGTWKKEDELKQLKSEVAALERKIQITLAPTELQNSIDESKIKTTFEKSNPAFTVESDVNDNRKAIKGIKL